MSQGFLKGAERRIRRTVIQILGRSSRDGNRAIELPENPSILLIRTDRIGDVLVSIPTIRLLRERFPDATIDMLVGRRNRMVAPIVPDIDETPIVGATIRESLATARNLRRTGYDLAINLLATDSASAGLVLSRSGAKHRIGFEGELSPLYDSVVCHPQSPIHIVRETSLLLEPLGIEPIGEEPEREADRLRIEIDAESHRWAEYVFSKIDSGGQRIVTMNISGTGETKFLGVEKYVELVGAVRELGLYPLIAGSRTDEKLLARIASESAAMALPTTLSLAQFAALLERSDIVTTPDTSIVHLAAALGKPTVGMFVAEHDRVWGPWGVPHRIVRGEQSIAEIPVNKIAEALDVLRTATVSYSPSDR